MLECLGILDTTQGGVGATYTGVAFAGEHLPDPASLPASLLPTTPGCKAGRKVRACIAGGCRSCLTICLLFWANTKRGKV